MRVVEIDCLAIDGNRSGGHIIRHQVGRIIAEVPHIAGALLGRDNACDSLTYTINKAVGYTARGQAVRHLKQHEVDFALAIFAHMRKVKLIIRNGCWRVGWRIRWNSGVGWRSRVGWRNRWCNRVGWRNRWCNRVGWRNRWRNRVGWCNRWRNRVGWCATHFAAIVVWVV